MRTGRTLGRGRSSISNVWWDSPAYKAGLIPAMELLAVNGQAFKSKVLNEAVLQAERDRKPIELQVKDGDTYKTLSVPHDEGLRFPALERVEGTPDRLDDILRPGRSALPAMYHPREGARRVAPSASSVARPNT